MASTARLALRIGHADQVRALAHSPDRRLLATGDDLGHVLIWEHATGERRAVRPAAIGPSQSWPASGRVRHIPRTGIGDLAFVGDGVLAVALESGGVETFDLATGARMCALATLHGPLTGDGPAFWAWQDGGTLVRVDPRTGATVASPRLEPAPVDHWRRRPRVDARHRRIAHASDGEVRVWDIDTGAVVAEHRIGPPEARVSNAALSPDGTAVATMGADHLTVTDLATGASRHVASHLGEPRQLVWLDEGIFAPGLRLECWDGARASARHGWVAALAPESPVALGGLGTVEIKPAGWTPAADSPLLWVAERHAGVLAVADGLPAVRAVACRADTVVALYADDLVRTWCLATGTLLGAVRAPWGVPAALDADGTRVLSVGWRAAWVWEVATCRVVWRVDLGGNVDTAPRFWDTSLAHGRVAALVGGPAAPALAVWELGTGARREWPLPWRPRRIGIAPDGSVVVAGGRSGCELLRVTTDGEGGGTPRALPASRDEVTSLALSPDGARLVVGYLGFGVEDRRGAPAGGEPGTGDGTDGWVCVPTHGDSLTVATTNDGPIAGAPAYDAGIWHHDPATGRGRALAGHRGPTGAVAFSEDGRWLASGATDGAVCVRHATTGRLVVTFQVLPGGDRWLARVPSGAWRGEGAERFVGDGYAAAPASNPPAVICALRRSHPR